jgi:hypothetical protein
VRFVRRYVVAAAVLPLLATGCSDDPQPKFEPSPSDSPSESSSDPAEPEAWEVKSEKGAGAFIEHWLETVTSASNTGATDDLERLGTRACETCSAISSYIDEVYSEGGDIKVAPWRLLDIGRLAGDIPLGEPVISTRVRKPVEVVHRKSPDKEVRVPAETYNLTFSLTWTGQGWLVSDADRVES